MEPQNKCEALADDIRKILSKGIDLSSDVTHYIDSTFSNPTPAELRIILKDDSNCEKDSLLELLLFPDETMQLQLEGLLERLHFQKVDEEAVLNELLKGTLAVPIRFPGDRGSLHLKVTEDLACQFISRLNISKHLNPHLIEALNHYRDENISGRIKVKIRNSRFSPTEEKTTFLGLFFEKFDSQDNEIFKYLEFLLNFLDETGYDIDIYRSLMAKKKFYFRSLQKAKQIERQLQKHNIETLLAQGKRVLLIDHRNAREKMRIIDRVSQAVFGKTEYFEPLQDSGKHFEVSVREKYGGP